MSKIISLLLFGGIMAVEVIATVLVYLLAFAYLVFTEIIGTKAFKAKFTRLNKGTIEQLINVSKTYKKIMDRV